MPDWSTNSLDVQLLQGNYACALGAIAAGCRFYAGYPITPSSEIAEWMSQALPPCDGVFIQMEDEMASMGAVLGASLGGAKAMTATSGPGFSLMQEHLGYAAGAEIPCVVVDVMRGGPSTGMPTRPSQGDVMQARWGTHGDHPVVVLTPASVREIYHETVRAFNLSETYRVPVVILYDEVLGHLMETVTIPAPNSLSIVNRKLATGAVESYQPYAETGDKVPPMARFGDGYRSHTTGLTHAESGFPTQDPETVDRMMRRLLGKLVRHIDAIASYQALYCDDAEVLVVAYGITARAAQRAVAEARQHHIKAGLFRPITLWPFPEAPLQRAAAGAKTVLVPEMNAGQLVLEVERLCAADRRVVPLNRFDGEPIFPRQILQHLNGEVKDG
jgi:2-oxoglutarate ferredoxin oxidoreductase subunit alpha